MFYFPFYVNFSHPALPGDSAYTFFVIFTDSMYKPPGAKAGVELKIILFSYANVRDSIKIDARKPSDVVFHKIFILIMYIFSFLCIKPPPYPCRSYFSSYVRIVHFHLSCKHPRIVRLPLSRKNTGVRHFHIYFSPPVISAYLSLSRFRLLIYMLFSVLTLIPRVSAISECL